MRFGNVDFRTVIQINGVTGPSGQGIRHNSSGNIEFTSIGGAGGIVGTTSLNPFYDIYADLRNRIIYGADWANQISGYRNIVKLANNPFLGETHGLFDVSFFNPPSPSGTVWKGMGLFLNPNWLASGLNMGPWNVSTQLSVDEGDFVLWAPPGRPYQHYMLIDNSFIDSNPPHINTQAWSKVSFIDNFNPSGLNTGGDYGYFPVWNYFEWDWFSEVMVYREDLNGNSVRITKPIESSIGWVEGTIWEFPWGSNRVFGNRIENSYLNIRNNRYLMDNMEPTFYFTDNIITDGSEVIIEEQTVWTTSSVFRKNIIKNSIISQGVKFDLDFKNNVLIDSNLINIYTPSQFQKNEVKNNYLVGSTFSSIQYGESPFLIAHNYLNQSTINNIDDKQNLSIGVTSILTNNFLNQSSINGIVANQSYLPSIIGLAINGNHMNGAIIDGISYENDGEISRNLFIGANVSESGNTPGFKQISLAEPGNISNNVIGGVIADINLDDGITKNLINYNYLDKGSALRNFNIQYNNEEGAAVKFSGNHLSVDVILGPSPLSGPALTLAKTVNLVNFKMGVRYDLRDFDENLPSYWESISKDISGEKTMHKIIDVSGTTKYEGSGVDAF